MSDTKDIVFAILGSGAFFSFLQYMLNRHDNKKNVEKRLSEKIDGVQTEVKEVKAELSKDIKGVADGLEEHRAVLARTHILRFSDELHAGQVHSDEYFRQQIIDIDTYNAYCATHPDFANGLTKMASDFIKDEYRKHYLTNDTD